jgi:hypothetical protein
MLYAPGLDPGAEPGIVVFVNHFEIKIRRAFIPNEG